MSKNKETAVESLKIPKIVLVTVKLLEIISPKLLTLFTARLFTTPLKHRIPKREYQMDNESVQIKLFIPAINKEIILYLYGHERQHTDETKRDKKILLVHGWSGRGTQLVKIADALINHNYSTVSFDAPAHGKSKGNTTLMPEFIASILEIEKELGPFEYAIGHSLGGMSILNAITKGLKIKKAVTIGSADIIQDIIDDFVAKLKLKPIFGIKLKEHFENKFGQEMDSFSSSRVAKSVSIPILVIHDSEDTDVNVDAAYHIYENLKKGELLITEGLGHRKILGNEVVIKNIIKFIHS